MAAGYERFLRDAERAGLADIRGRLLAGAAGTTLEVGAGTGLNLRHYPGAVTELVLTEPSPHMARRLRNRLKDAAVPARVERASAELLPFPDASFDTVVATFVLCTVPDMVPALSELRRVLRPGGRYLFLEHVRSDDADLAARQDRWHVPWRLFGDGCNCNRDIAAVITAFFDVEEITHGRQPRMPAIVTPIITGAARVPGADPGR
jgi:ubiquinone/menaquinone biosynthesis C-methylase UbiE